MLLIDTFRTAYFFALERLAKQPHGLQRPRAGSEVVRITPPSVFDGHNSTVTPIFRDSGAFYGSSSTAVAVSKERMIVTGLYEHGLLDCKVSFA